METLRLEMTQRKTVFGGAWDTMKVSAMCLRHRGHIMIVGVGNHLLNGQPHTLGCKECIGGIIDVLEMWGHLGGAGDVLKAQGMYSRHLEMCW